MDLEYKNLKKMDKNEAIKVARKYVDFIATKYQVESAILFGSYAKGTNHTDSDIDLAIIFKSIEDIIDLQIELMCLRRDDDLLNEPHTFSDSDFEFSNPIV